MPRPTSRRDFLRTSAALAAAGAAVPHVWTGRATGGEAKNDRPLAAAIGVGGQGTGIGNRAAAHAEMIACADVDRDHAERFAAKYQGKCRTYADYRAVLDRKEIEIVTIGTPDHWHTKIAIEAMKAGKDVYCEKPLTLTIAEGQAIAKVLRETEHVFQVGTQQRSQDRSMFLKAVALTRAGRLGKKITAHAFIGAAPSQGPFPTEQAPAGLNWEMWLGQTPLVPYTKQRCHGSFRWWLEYSGGKLTDWGAHHIDISQWAVGCELTGPVEIEGEGQWPQGREATLAMLLGKNRDLPNGYNTATQFQIKLAFANGNTIIVRHRPDEAMSKRLAESGPPPQASSKKGKAKGKAKPRSRDNGIVLEGEKGWLFVSRGELFGKPLDDLSENEKKWLDEEVIRLYKGKQPGDHMRNFFECVKDRTQPISDVFTHHRSMSSLPPVQPCHARGAQAEMESRTGGLRRRRGGHRPAKPGPARPIPLRPDPESPPPPVVAKVFHPVFRLISESECGAGRGGESPLREVKI